MSRSSVANVVGTLGGSEAMHPSYCRHRRGEEAAAWRGGRAAPGVPTSPAASVYLA
jgi:hypothetical protein